MAQALLGAVGGPSSPTWIGPYLTGRSCVAALKWNGTKVTFTLSIDPRTLVRPAEVWSWRIRRQKPT